MKTDAELVAAVAGGDRRALGQLVRRHQDDTFALALRVLGDPAAARDVVQEAFLRVYRAAGRYRPEAKFTAWLYRIVVNLCVDEGRRTGRAPVELVRDIPGDPPPDPVERRETMERVRGAVMALPERQRTALILCRYHELSHKQIAAVTGWSPSAVESLLVRAYASLRERLADLREK